MEINDGDTVELEYVGRKVDGSVFDTSREAVAEEAGLDEQYPGRDWEPITIEVGSGQLIEGLEEGLIGIGEGETATITVPPEEGYGEPQDDNVMQFDRETVEAGLEDDDLEEGLYVETESGGVGTIESVGEETVVIDFNHELAGETLEFEIEVLSVDD